jgi:hypothetical protein
MIIITIRETLSSFVILPRVSHSLVVSPKEFLVTRRTGFSEPFWASWSASSFSATHLSPVFLI